MIGTTKNKRLLFLAAVIFLLTLTALFALTSVTAAAETVGDFEITGGASGTDYTYADGVLTINTSAALTVKNTHTDIPTTDTIVIASGVDADITLAGVNIDVSADDNVCALMIANDSTGNVKITLADGTTNILKSGKSRAGLQKNGSNGSLEITGSTGKLIAVGGHSGSGIGSNSGGVCCNITISGGVIEATGGGSAAGIGTGGSWKKCTNITISGGSVTAQGGGCGAGIGGGYGGSCSDVLISGGWVTAKGSNGGAGIGGGDYCGSGTNITVSGGTVIAIGGSSGAGIGGGRNGEGIEASGRGTNITVSGGTVTAKSGTGAGIGGGEKGIGADITISGGSVKTASTDGNLIGGGKSCDAVAPVNGASEKVYLLVIKNPSGSTVYIDNTAYSLKNHTAADSTDTNLYVYVTGTTHTANVDGTDTVYNFHTDKFLAVPKAVDFSVTAFYDLVYDGREKTATVTAADGITGMGEIYVKYYDESGNEAVPVNVGTYTLKVDTAEGESYEAISSLSADYWTFTVESASPGASDFIFEEPADLIYSGTAKSAVVTAADGIAGMGDITVRYYDEKGNEVEPVNVGTYKVKIETAEGDNYKAASVASSEWTFIIEKACPKASDFIFEEPADLIYSGTAKSAVVTAADGIAGMGKVTVKYYDQDGINPVNPINVNSYTVKIDVEAGANYTAANDLTMPDWTFSVTKATAAVTDAKLFCIWNKSGEQNGAVSVLPADMGLLGEAVVVGIADDSQILGDSASFKNGILTYTLDSNTADEIGKFAVITVTQPCQNYEDITFNAVITLTDKKTQNAPTDCKLYFEDNGDGTYKAVITAVNGAEYKFGNGQWSKSNVLESVPHGVTVNAQVRMAESADYKTSGSISISGKSAHGTMTMLGGQAADCENDGAESYWYCSACDKYFGDANGTVQIAVSDTVIEKTGHSWSVQYVYDYFAHWRQCDNESCPITNNELKNDYGEHRYDRTSEDGEEICVVCGYVKGSVISSADSEANNSSSENTGDILAGKGENPVTGVTVSLAAISAALAAVVFSRKKSSK